MRSGSPRSRRRATVGALLLAGLACVAPPSAHALGTYVALGDSYTAGPLILVPKGDPIDCGRSDHNYPTFVSQALAPSDFRDVSCGSAQTKDMTGPQTGLPLGGTNRPQFDALSPQVELVTVGIGGNDMGFGTLVSTCVSLGLQSGGTGRPCTDHFTAGGVDQIRRRLDEVVAPRVAAVIQGIQQRSPRARVLLVGDPNPLPSGAGCFPLVPLAAGDLPYLTTVAENLGRTKARVAAEQGAEFVDLVPGSIGHDICTPQGTRWYEGIVPLAPAFPAHPNSAGMEFAAREVLAAIARPVRNGFSIPLRRATRKGELRLRLRAPARGAFTVTARARGRAYASGGVVAARATDVSLRLKPIASARRRLARYRSLRVTLRIAFAPVAGEPAQRTVALRVRMRR